MGLPLYFAQIRADARAVASRGLKAPILVWGVSQMALEMGFNF